MAPVSHPEPSLEPRRRGGMQSRFALPLLVVLAISLVAGGCAGGRQASNPPSPAPTPTPIAVDVTSPEAAAALVIATDPRFAGTIKLTPDLIGASRWWESEPLASGGFRIKLTIGWGDCPSGCINRHVWTYDVTADGQVVSVSESGDPIPAGSLPPG